MYGHGFATLFLGEIYGMNPADKRVRDALVRAVGDRLRLRCRKLSNGNGVVLELEILGVPVFCMARPASRAGVGEAPAPGKARR